MIILFNKRKVLVVALLILLCVGFTGAGYKIFISKKTFLPGETKTIIIDAGHGSPDGGAVGSSGVLEKDLNLSIAKKLQEFAEQGGFNVILTRSDDNGIYDISGNIRSKKNSDLKNREKLIKNSKADAFVSIHMNKFPQSKYSGPQVFYSGNNEKSKDLAEYIQESVIEALTPVSKREIKKADGSIYLLKNAKLPAVLVECGFLSNEEEQRKLLDTAYQKQVAWAIYCGIIKYFNEE